MYTIISGGNTQKDFCYKDLKGLQDRDIRIFLQQRSKITINTNILLFMWKYTK